LLFSAVVFGCCLHYIEAGIFI